jgi:Arc/MetJ-type ribon-helix-helix transcriptional regulator
MSYGFSPELSRLVQQQMASGRYNSEDDLLVDAIHALDGLREQHEQLGGEIRSRLERAGQGHSQPLDRDAFKAEARRRLSEEG